MIKPYTSEDRKAVWEQSTDHILVSRDVLKLYSSRSVSLLDTCLQDWKWQKGCTAVKLECFLGVTLGARSRLQLWGISTIHKHLCINGLTQTEKQSLHLSNQILGGILYPHFPPKESIANIYAIAQGNKTDNKARGKLY